jgi:hypothetical protein
MGVKTKMDKTLPLSDPNAVPVSSPAASPCAYSSLTIMSWFLR